MRWRLPLAGAAMALGQRAREYIGRLVRARQFALTGDALVVAFIEVLVSVIPGEITNRATGRPAWGLAVFLAALVLLAFAKTKLEATPVQQSSDAPTGEFATNGAGYGVVLLRADAARPLAQILGTVTSSPLQEVPAGSTQDGPMIDLEKERDELKRALKAARSGVILVYGPPGAGKSMLVTTVTRDMKPKPVLHKLAVNDWLDTKTLLDDIDPSAQTGLKPGDDPLRRLKAQLAAPYGARVTIIIDGAQSLFEPNNHLDDEVLAQALEVIAAGQPRRVKVILVVQEHPVPGSGSTWHGTADRIFVGGLHREYFTKFLEILNPAFEFGLPDRTTAEPGELYDVLQGNPRLAELFCAALGLPESHLSAVGLMNRLKQEATEEPEKLFAGEVVHSLSEPQRRVVAALAAYGIPVTLEQVNKVLAGAPSAGQVEVLVPELVNRHVIGRVGDEAPDRYYLPSQAIVGALPREDLSFALLSDAAEQLNDGWTPPEEIKHLEDLASHFAELDVRVRAARYGETDDPWGPAYEAVNELDERLRRWNAAGLLFKYRKVIKGELHVPYREMVNSNALGLIYMSRGRFDDARDAFRDALLQSGKMQPTDMKQRSYGRRKILINLASLAWNSGKTADAEESYSRALEECAASAEPDTIRDRVTAEDGLADCCRRGGRLRDAIEHGQNALAAAQVLESLSQVVDITVKLAQWHAELGQRHKADQFMRDADDAAGSDAALRARYLAGHADLLLGDGRLREARKVAKKALRKAPQAPDTPTALQARASLAMASVLLGKTRAARREIDRAVCLRQAGGSLDMPALRALIVFRSHPKGTEAAELFEELKRAAVQRQDHDKQDLAACAFEALAICGLRACGAGTLDGAMKALRKATSHENAPGLDARLKQWLEILRTKATSDWLKPFFAAIDSRAAAPGRP